jgi:hypothetical protein
MPVIPVTWEVDMGRLWFETSLAKVSGTLFQKIGQAWWHIPEILATQEVEVGGLQLEVNQSKKHETLFEK